MKSRIYEFAPVIYPFQIQITKDFDEGELKGIYKIINSSNEEVDATDEFANNDDTTARVVNVVETESEEMKYLVLLFQPMRIGAGIAAHEAVHLANAYLQYLGFGSPAAYNDEPYAYFVQWVTNCIWSVLVNDESSMNGKLIEVIKKKEDLESVL